MINLENNLSFKSRLLSAGGLLVAFLGLLSVTINLVSSENIVTTVSDPIAVVGLIFTAVGVDMIRKGENTNG